MDSERVSSSCSTSGTRRVNLVTNSKNGLFHMICVATVEKNKIKEECPRLRLNIQICQSIAGCHQVIHQESSHLCTLRF
jgi:hypothetical protein